MIDEAQEAPMMPEQYNSADVQLASIERPRRLDITFRQNIDERIKQAQAVVKELEASKERMEKSGILDMRIDDILSAMQF